MPTKFWIYLRYLSSAINQFYKSKAQVHIFWEGHKILRNLHCWENDLWSGLMWILFSTIQLWYFNELTLNQILLGNSIGLITANKSCKKRAELCKSEICTLGEKNANLETLVGSEALNTEDNQKNLYWTLPEFNKASILCT